eukprot:TRINITY_DN1901_c0_g1_i1.p1 TRINITY_DN1901_c0_g1~~TRINITY_DN1901_c0_g1_i1.p1  ORF type:complete len:814 (+),score=169.55 TRINITY_DN1901_c0_g1_i1:89-2530(+)
MANAMQPAISCGTPRCMGVLKLASLSASAHVLVPIIGISAKEVGKGEFFGLVVGKGSGIVQSTGARTKLKIQATAGPGGASQGRGSNVKVSEKQASLREQNKRLLAMQKELLEQIEERKKLHSAVLESLNDPAAKIKAFNEAETMGLPPLTRRSEAPSISAASSPPRSPPPPDAQSTPSSPLLHSSTLPPFQSAAEASITTPTKPPVISSGPVVVPSEPARVPSTPSQMPPVSKPATTSRSVAAPAQRAAVTAPSPTPTVPFKSPSPPLQPKAEPVPFSSRFSSVASPTQFVEKAPVRTKEDVDLEKGPKEKPPPLAGENVMNVVVVASECAPWSKTGGLGDVVGALPKALARRGHRVMVVVPRYSNYDEAWETGVRKQYNIAGQDCEVGYFHGFIDGVDFVFVDHPSFHAASSNIYGGGREAVQFRMTLFNKAAIEVPWHVPCGGITYGDSNLVFIANDWHTALLPVYLQAYYRDHGIMNFARSILVIHNMAHQGRAPVVEFAKLGLPDHYLDKFKLYDPVGGEHMNVLMAGLITAHRLVAVSHGYAWECQTAEGGWGLHNVMQDHGWKLRGVVNGIDEKEWDPETDVFLNEDGYQTYNLQTLDRGKPMCKAALQRELGLPVRDDVPLLGFIGRLDYQKGVDLIQQAMGWLMSQDVQVVMLGSGRGDLEDMLRSMESNHKDKCRGWVGFSVKMAHRITAASDVLLMPSRFEPCGLNQLYAMRYGTVPVVHSVGGLRDTVQAFDPFNDTGLGWTFDRAETPAFIHALGNTLYTYREFKDSWGRIQRRGMSQDLSWDNAAQQYEEVLVAAKYQW